MTHICVSKTYHHCFRYLLLTWSAPSHYLNQCCHIVNYTIRNMFQWNFHQNSKVFIHENALENVVCEMAAILSLFQCVNAAVIAWSNVIGYCLTHWGRVTHICVSKLNIIGSDNGLSPGRRQAIIWTNAGILLIGPLGTNFSQILTEIYTFSFKKMHLKMSSAKWRPFCLGLNVLTTSVKEM